MRNALSLLTAACVLATGQTALAQFTTKDTSTPSYVQFSAPRYQVSESATNAVVTLVRSGDYRVQASVDYTTKEGTAEDGVDFKACGGTIVFPAGQSFRTITIPIIRDSQASAKTFQVELAQADPFTTVVTPTAEVEIKPQPPALTIAAKGGGLLISWPDAGLPFVLEALIEGAWSSVAEPASKTDSTWAVNLVPTAPVALFRLRAQEQTAQ